jgi:TRAP-type mannitol/chloroaromatic compound transport system substrate-binding protein
MTPIWSAIATAPDMRAASTLATLEGDDVLLARRPNPSNEVNAETSAANADYKRVWDSILAFRNDEYLWWQVAEFSYDSFMIRTRTKA